MSASLAYPVPGAAALIDPVLFADILSKADARIVVCSMRSSWLTATTYEYLTAYKGLIFYTTSTTPLEVPEHIEILPAAHIFLPS